jgi:hypothetical protein
VKKKNRNRKDSTGWAETKRVPHVKHPAFYKKKGQDDVDYVTFTHSLDVDLDGKKIEALPLKSNINKNERGKSISHVLPKVYRGKRSALGKDTDKYSLTKEDRIIVDDVFENCPVEYVKFTGNSKDKKKKDKF